MNWIKHYLVPFFSLILLLISGCARIARTEQEEYLQMIRYAETYFDESYSVSVEVISVSQERVGQNDYLPVINVASDDGKSYKLIFDKNGYPLADDFEAVSVIECFDFEQIRELANSHGLEGEQTSVGVSFDYSEKRYLSTVYFETRILPSSLTENSMYALLGKLQELGIDQFWIGVTTPTFLLGNNMYGIQLYADKFSTNLDQDSFEKLFQIFSEHIFWSEEKFHQKKEELELSGYHDINFYVTRITGNAVEINVSATPVHSRGDAQKLEELLIDVDESYFKIAGKETVICATEGNS